MRTLISEHVVAEIAEDHLDDNEVDPYTVSDALFRAHIILQSVPR